MSERSRGRPATTIANETRLEKALRLGWYEEYREQLTDLVVNQELRHVDIGRIMGNSKSTTQFMCRVLGITSNVERGRNQSGVNQYQTPLGDHEQRRMELELVSVIRRHRGVYDRGW